jgi:hypothetical protein
LGDCVFKMCFQSSIAENLLSKQLLKKDPVLPHYVNMIVMCVHYDVELVSFLFCHVLHGSNQQSDVGSVRL